MFAGKPVIGIVGGIGSGKSFAAGLFGELGCVVISSDAQVAEVYREGEVQKTLRGWWGDQTIAPDGSINRSAIAARIFNDPVERKRLEELIHPRVSAARRRVMESAQNDPHVRAFVWDTPLLFETGLNEQCDAVVYVDAPFDQRQSRVQQSRGWRADELARRENSQWPLDRKRKISDYVLSNTADAGDAPEQLRSQVRDVLSRILAQHH